MPTAKIFYRNLNIAFSIPYLRFIVDALENRQKGGEKKLGAAERGGYRRTDQHSLCPVLTAEFYRFAGASAIASSLFHYITADSKRQRKALK